MLQEINSSILKICKMLDNLIYCLNATMPVFLLMLLGYVFNFLKILDKEFTKKLNSFVFKIALPVLVFEELAAQDIRETWDSGYVAFCFLVTLLSIIILLVISYLFKGIYDKAEFVQASFRSSAALLGVGIVQNLYGDAGMVPLMIIGAVPLYNITAVILLEIIKPGEESGHLSKDKLKETLIGIITNPIILGIIVGFIWSTFKIPQPVIFSRTIKHIGNLATPLGLMALGASLDFKSVGEKKGTVIAATVFKLIGFCALFLPLAMYVGYTNDKLLAILIMLGSPTTVSSFVMAKSMGHDGQTSAGTVMLTTLFSAFTLTLWLFILKSFNYI